MGYRSLDHTADLGLELEAPSADELFVEALRGLADCLTEIDRIEPSLEKRFELTAEGLDLLLVDWLSEILYVFETEGVVLATAEASVEEGKTGGYRLVARAWGERFAPSHHRLKIPIKAVTYHGLRVDRRPDWVEARVIFDV